MTIKQNSKIFLLFSIVFLILLSKLAKAESDANYTLSNNAKPEKQFSIGIGTVLTNEPYKEIDTKVRVIPFFLYRTRNLSLYGPIMNYSLFNDKSYDLGIIAKARFEGYEEDDSDFLQGMDEREWTFELGTYASKEFNFGKINADFSADILNRHQGYELKSYYSYTFRNVLKTPGLMISPNIGINYRSEHLNNYYFGVRSSEAIVGRPVYNAGDSIGLIAGASINYMFSEKTSIMGMISFEWLGDEIKKSPVVDKNFESSFILGIVYNF